MTYWPWWLGSFVFGGLTVGYWLALGRSLGASGVWYRVLRQPRVSDDAATLLDSDAFREAMLAATLAQFGPDVATGDAEGAVVAAGGPVDLPAKANPAAGASECRIDAPRIPTPWSADLLFLVMVVLGGVLAARMTGTWQLHFDQGVEFTRLVGTGWRMVAALFFGGLLIGFGTTMAGGCTTGHGLTGCSSFQKGSFVAIASFFGTAILGSFLLEWWVR